MPHPNRPQKPLQQQNTAQNTNKHVAAIKPPHPHKENKQLTLERGDRVGLQSNSRKGQQTEINHADTHLNGVIHLLSDFNILASTMRGNERQMCHELAFLLKEAGDPNPDVDKTGIRGLVVAKTTLNPTEAIEKLRVKLQEKPYEFRYAFRIIPIEKVIPTYVEEVKKIAEEFATRLAEADTFRVTVEKRFTSIHSHDLIEAAATAIPNKVDLDNPTKILLIEILGGYTGMALVKPTEIISVQKEKML